MPTELVNPQHGTLCAGRRRVLRRGVVTHRLELEPCRILRRTKPRLPLVRPDPVQLDNRPLRLRFLAVPLLWRADVDQLGAANKADAQTAIALLLEASDDGVLVSLQRSSARR